MDDSLWDLGLSDAALIGIFAAVMLLASVAVLVWAVAVPESTPEPDEDHAGSIVERAERGAAQVEHDLEDETGRLDPAVAWTR